MNEFVAGLIGFGLFCGAVYLIIKKRRSRATTPGEGTPTRPGTSPGENQER